MDFKIITFIIGIIGIGFWSYIWLSRLERIVKNDIKMSLDKLIKEHK